MVEELHQRLYSLQHLFPLPPALPRPRTYLGEVGWWRYSGGGSRVCGDGPSSLARTLQLLK